MATVNKTVVAQGWGRERGGAPSTRGGGATCDAVQVSPRPYASFQTQNARPPEWALTETSGEREVSAQARRLYGHAPWAGVLTVGVCACEGRGDVENLSASAQFFCDPGRLLNSLLKDREEINSYI